MRPSRRTFDAAIGGERVEDEKTALQLLDEMTKGLLKNVLSEIEGGKDVSPELIREIRECIQAIYH